MNKNCIIEIKDFEFEIKGNPNLNYGFGLITIFIYFFRSKTNKLICGGKWERKIIGGEKKNEREMKRKKKKGRK